jgi:S1-C subfamily serine protease
MGTGVDGVDEVSLSRRLDCAVYGFPCIYDIYKPSILPLVHTTQSERASVGTSFVIGTDVLQTAAHCIDGAKRLSIRGITAAELASARFFKSANSAIDLGLIHFSALVFERLPALLADEPVLLQDVMAVGFPDVPGFLPELAAEKALISSRLTVSRGAVASTPFEIFARAELLLVTARVRGGFSGGPILNDKGDYVGVVSRDPIHQAGDPLDKAIHLYDNLGYGIAIPATLARAFTTDALRGANELSVQMDMSGTEFAEFDE